MEKPSPDVLHKILYFVPNKVAPNVLQAHHSLPDIFLAGAVSAKACGKLSYRRIYKILVALRKSRFQPDSDRAFKIYHQTKGYSGKEKEIPDDDSTFRLWAAVLFDDEEKVREHSKTVDQSACSQALEIAVVNESAKAIKALLEVKSISIGDAFCMAAMMGQVGVISLFAQDSRVSQPYKGEVFCDLCLAWTKELNTFFMKFFFSQWLGPFGDGHYKARHQERRNVAELLCGDVPAEKLNETLLKVVDKFWQVEQAEHGTTYVQLFLKDQRITSATVDLLLLRAVNFEDWDLINLALKDDRLSPDGFKQGLLSAAGKESASVVRSLLRDKQALPPLVNEAFEKVLNLEKWKLYEPFLCHKDANIELIKQALKDSQLSYELMGTVLSRIAGAGRTDAFELALAHPQASDTDVNVALFSGFRRQQMGIVKLLLKDKRIDVVTVHNVLNDAIALGQMEYIRLFVNHRSMTPKFVDYALHHAATSDKNTAVNLIRNRFFDGCSKEEWEALLKPAEANRLKVIELLLKDPRLTRKHFCDAIRAASQSGHFDRVKAFMEDPRSDSFFHWHKEAISLAEEKSYDKIAGLLKSHRSKKYRNLFGAFAIALVLGGALVYINRSRFAGLFRNRKF